MLISWNTTRACNLKCKHCYRDAGEKEKNELNFSEAGALLEEIKKAGFRIVVLSGGEPLLRKDIYDICAYGKRLGLRMVLGSNGTLLDRSSAERLKAAGLSRAGVSLDSINAENHDQFRGVKGSFDLVHKGMQNMLDSGLEFQVHTTVTRHNYTEMEEMVDYVAELGAAAYHVFFLVPTGRGKEEAENLISPSEYFRLIAYILDRQKDLAMELKPVCAPQFMPLAKNKGLDLRFARGCLAGTHYCCVLPNGDVHPCPYLPLNLGNVREIPFSKIWSDNPVLQKLRTLDYSGACGTCKNKDICGGCRARAYYHSGDFMAEDYYCKGKYGLV